MQPSCNFHAPPRAQARRSWLRAHPFRSILALLALSSAAVSPAQALATATQLSHIAVFAEYESLSPNVYGNPPERGIAAGIDFSRLGGPIPISFEARGTVAPAGQFVGQRSGTVGVRFDIRHRHLTRVQPYVNFLVGVGEIVFGPLYNTGSASFRSDNSLIDNFGGGLDYLLPGKFALQAEFQQQHWNFGNAMNPEPFSPTMINVGLRYTIPFRPRYGD